MITFHPTISFSTFIKRLLTPAVSPEPRLTALFPGHSITLTDSGRSALGLIIETLGLEHKRVALPAYLCNNVLPVLEHYHITPVFLDVDPTTYQPSPEAYLNASCDAVLLVATYGRIPNTSLVTTLKQKNVVVIEDYAHVSLPLQSTTLESDARYYSVSKTLPVPDGGVAVIPKSTLSKDEAQSGADSDFFAHERQKSERRSESPTMTSPSITFTSIKDIKKVWWFVAYTLAFIRIFITRSHGSTHAPAWHGIARMRALSQRFLGHALSARTNEPYKETIYCRPMTIENPDTEQSRLFKKGIVAERIWNHPIVESTNIDASQFPNTQKIAQHVLCVPAQ